MPLTFIRCHTHISSSKYFFSFFGGGYPTLPTCYLNSPPGKEAGGVDIVTVFQTVRCNTKQRLFAQIRWQKGLADVNVNLSDTSSVATGIEMLVFRSIILEGSFPWHLNRFSWASVMKVSETSTVVEVVRCFICWNANSKRWTKHKTILVVLLSLWAC